MRKLLKENEAFTIPIETLEGWINRIIKENPMVILTLWRQSSLEVELESLGGFSERMVGMVRGGLDGGDGGEGVWMVGIR